MVGAPSACTPVAGGLLPGPLPSCAPPHPFLWRRRARPCPQPDGLGSAPLAVPSLAAYRCTFGPAHPTRPKPFCVYKRAFSCLHKQVGLMPTHGPGPRSKHGPMHWASPKLFRDVSCLGRAFFPCFVNPSGPAQMYTSTTAFSSLARPPPSLSLAGSMPPHGRRASSGLCACASPPS
jgi:hypothetical protein